MSSLARWANTSKATYWSLTGFDDWTQEKTYGPPVVIDCDYSAESKRMTDANGIEFTTRQIIYTECADLKQGDFILIGESATASPIAAGAFEVRAITRDADTFEGKADDYRVMT
jgi:hypothetical protein